MQEWRSYRTARRSVPNSGGPVAACRDDAGFIAAPVQRIDAMPMLHRDCERTASRGIEDTRERLSFGLEAFC